MESSDRVKGKKFYSFCNKRKGDVSKVDILKKESSFQGQTVVSGNCTLKKGWLKGGLKCYD